MLSDRLQEQRCAPSLRIPHLSVTGSGFVVNEYTSRLKDYTEEGDFMYDRQELLNQVQSMFACEKLRPSNRMRNSVL